MTARDNTEVRLQGTYRTLLRVYPTHFRDAFGLDMEETFVDRLRQARAGSKFSLLTFLLLATFDAITNGTRERLNFQRSGAQMFHAMDVRYAFRLLRRSPFFTLLTVIVLSGGLGLSIFTFSFLHTAMLKPIPISNGERVVSVRVAIGTNSGPFDLADVASMRASIKAITDVGVYANRSIVVGTEEKPRVISATASQWDIFKFTRTSAALGRTFMAEDADVGAEPVIVLSYRVWKNVFGADSSVIGRKVMFNNASTRVVGVMPLGFGFPIASDAWVPLSNDALAANALGTGDVFVYGLLSRDATQQSAETQLTTLFKRARLHDQQAVTGEIARQIAEASALSRVTVESFPVAQMGEEGPLLFTVLNVLSGLILLLACINVTNLLLARSNERVQETAVRLALGASCSRLIMQSMWESVLLCVAGGVVATAIAAWGLDAINAWAHVNLEGNLAFWWVWRLDRSALIAAALFVTATIALLGIVVSGRATSLQFAAVLKEGGVRSSGKREGRIARVLVVSQVATVSIVMFFGLMSGIIAYRVVKVDLGFSTKNLLTTTVSLDDKKYANESSRSNFYRNTFNELAASPAISDVLFRSYMATIKEKAGEFELGNQRGIAGTKPRAYIQALFGSPSALGMTMRGGRAFDAHDDASGAPVAIISQALVDKYWPGESPIGRQINVARRDTTPEMRTIVGVVSNVMFGKPYSNDRSALAIYVPLLQTNERGAEFYFKYRDDLDAAGAVLHKSLHSNDATMLPPDVRSYDEITAKTSLIATSTAKLFGSCFLFAFLLAASGTYGLMARSIGQRTREIGLRRALGASNSVITRLLLKQGSRQLGIGVLISLPFMLLVGIGFWKLFPVGLFATIGSALFVATTIFAVVLLATYIPTRRAIRVELRDALRRE
ncbi:MAG: ABC transporter permease [Gemmatimonadaceae bacterium]